MVKRMNRNCVFCGTRIKGHGNNPSPARKWGGCCNDCQLKIVVPARIKKINRINGV
jgi:DNA-directed RNA polymerase subunit RPC12/RpoP